MKSVKNKNIVSESVVGANIGKALTYKEQGMKLREIEKKTNVPRSTIYNWLKKV